MKHTQDELEMARKKPLIPRAQWCAQELARSAKAAAEEPLLNDVARGTQLMAETMDAVVEALSRQARISERLGSCARFLLDQLTMDNAEVEAMYGRSDDLEGASKELRLAIKEWEAVR